MTWTSISSPIETISEGWWIRFHAMSVLWSNPSTPPRSTNAPKAVMFFTTPAMSWPTSSVFKTSSFFSAISASSHARRDKTMLCRRLLMLMTFIWKVSPMYWSRFCIGRNSTWEAGKNPRKVPTVARSPPLIRSVICPSTGEPLSKASVISSQTNVWSAIFFERLICPSESSRRTIYTSISSPTLTDGKSFSSESNSSAGI